MIHTLVGTGAENLIPIELAIKIARKIKARERFAAYIVIPMWPEGNPTTKWIIFNTIFFSMYMKF